MLISPSTEAALFGVLVVVLTTIGLFSRRHFLFGVGLLLPLMMPQIQAGVGIFWYKVLGPLACLIALVRGAGGGLRSSRVSVFGWVLAYSIVLSAIWMVLEFNYLHRYRLAAAMEMGGGVAQYEWKMPVQLVGFIAQALILFVVPLCARSLRDAKAASTGLFAGVATSVVVGLLHVVAFGSGTFNTPEETAVLILESGSLNRIGGLSGEPKLLGSVLAVVAVYFFSRVVFSSGRAGRRDLYAFALSSLGLFLTYSTSAWVAAALGVVAATLLALRRVSASRFVSLLTLMGVALLLLSSIGVVAVTVQSRIVDRLFGDSGELSKQKDMYVFDAFADQPLNSVFGFGLGGADFAVIPYVEWLHLQYKRTPTPGVTGVRMLGDLGIAGMLLFATVGGYWARVLRSRNDGPGAVFIVSGLIVAMSCSTMALSAYLFLAGTVLAVSHLAMAAEPLVAPETASVPQTRLERLA